MKIVLGNPDLILPLEDTYCMVNFFPLAHCVVAHWLLNITIWVSYMYMISAFILGCIAESIVFTQWLCYTSVRPVTINVCQSVSLVPLFPLELYVLRMHGRRHLTSQQFTLLNWVHCDFFFPYIFVFLAIWYHVQVLVSLGSQKTLFLVKILDIHMSFT